MFHFSNRFLGQKLLVSWNIVVHQYFHIINLVDSLALWNEFKMGSNLDVKKLMSIVFMCDFDMRTLFEPLIPFRKI
jgi:hypothetical protein